MQYAARGGGPAASSPVPVSRYIELLKLYLYPQRWLVGLLLVATFTVIGLSLFNPQVMRYFIDAAVDTSDTAPPLIMVTYAAVLYLSVAIVGQLVGIGNTYLSSYIAWNSTNRLREDVTTHCLRLDMSFHKNRTPGELIQRVDGDVAVLGNFFSSFLITILTNLLTLVGTVIILFMENPLIAGVLLTTSMTVVAATYFTRSIAVPYNKAMFEANSQLYGFVEERLSGKEDIRALDGIPWVMRNLWERYREIYRKSLMSSYVNHGISFVMMVCSSINHAVALGLGAYLFLANEITLGTVFMIVAYLNMLTGPLMGISRQVQALQQFRASVERVEELLGTPHRIVDGDGGRLPDGPLSVSWDDVHFAYDAGEPVLQGVSFRLAPGEVLGLLGRTGSGKSTIARLLFRFYDPDQGEIRIAGQQLPECQVADLRSHIGMVTQDVQLFSASVRDNLTFFDRSVPDERILSAIEQLGLSTWHRSLEKGLDTRIGDSAMGLSAGEAQLLAVTRVFLKQSGLMILDEASSRLDPATEGLLESAIDQLLAKQTAIIIAHRLETVRRADYIMILDEGRVVEYGRRQDLGADKNSRYSELLRVGMGPDEVTAPSGEEST